MATKTQMSQEVLTPTMLKKLERMAELNVTSDRKITAYELYYQRSGKKMSVLLNTAKEVAEKRRKLKANHKKFLGVRPVTLVEVR